MSITTKNLTKTYILGEIQVRALQDVSINIKKGEIVSIMGPSGSGKSTLLNLIGCLDTATSGTYTLDEINVNKEAPLAEIRNKKIGFVFQSFNLLPKLTAIQNVEVPMIYKGVAPRERLERAKKLLTEVGLEHRLTHKPNELSGGEKQRVAIARSLANKPSIILADEPTGNLDTKTGKEIESILFELHKKGVTVVIVTHDQYIADVTSRTIKLLDGRVVSQ